MNKQNITRNIKIPNNLEFLKKHYAHCFTKNGDFDFEKFKQSLSKKDEINFYKESYSLDWLGKSYARLLASDEATTLLKEDEKFNQKKENKNSENLLIKGDNIEVLKHLSNAYYEKVKMIYIDPPYNTGSDGFVYQDDRKFSVGELAKLAGIDEEKATRILDFTQSKSNSHSAWLTFMYPRLYIAKQLLRDDGVIFISIDDNEVAQLRLLMDEIFGEQNFLTEIIWINNQRGRSTDKFISNTYENILIYGKNIDSLTIRQELEVNDSKLAKYNLEDDKSFYKEGDNLFNNNSKFNIETRPNLVYSIYVDKNTNEWICIDEKFKDESGEWVLPTENKKGNNFIKVIPPIRNTNNKMGCWRWSIEKFEKEAKQELILRQKTDGIYMFFSKDRLDKDGKKWNKFKNIIQDFSSASGTTELVNIFDNKIFDSPKPTKLLKKVLNIGSNSSDIILDFFAGSGTTGDAVMQLNAEDGGNRKYILVQLPEKIDKKKNKTAYDFVKDELKVTEPTIFEITKERLIRSANKTKKEVIDIRIAEKQKEINELKNKLDLDNKKQTIKNLTEEIKQLNNQDLGFKIFETMPIWENYNFEADELDTQLEIFDDSKLTEEDLKALLITWKTYDGIPLTQDLQKIDLVDYTSYYANDRLYLIDEGFTTNNLKKLLGKIDTDKDFNPNAIITFGYYFESKNLREIDENIKSYTNKKNIDIDFIIRY